jgi:hypothetical protein
MPEAYCCRSSVVAAPVILRFVATAVSAMSHSNRAADLVLLFEMEGYVQSIAVIADGLPPYFNKLEVIALFYGILCHVPDISRNPGSKCPTIKLAGREALSRVSVNYKCSIQYSSTDKPPRLKLLMSALRLNQAKRWYGIEQVFRGTDVHTIPVLPFVVSEGLPINRAPQR